MGMNVSEKMREWIRKFEGLKLGSYKCPAGIWTIGYGHTRGVARGQYITQAQAEKLLSEDLAQVEGELNAALGCIRLTQGQFDAMASFVFNLGLPELQGSTLWRKIKANPADPSIPAEFRRWVYGTVDDVKQKLPGLVKRREVEARFWEGAA